MLHFTEIATSSVFQLASIGGAPGGCDLFHGILPARALEADECCAWSGRWS